MEASISNNQVVDTEIVERWQILEKESGLKFYFSRKQVTGPGGLRNYFVIVLHIAAVLTLFMYYDVNKYNTDLKWKKWIIELSVSILAFVALLGLSKTVFTEPGMITKPNPEQQYKNFQTYLYIKKFSYKSPESTFSYCKICQMFRKPRVSHCRKCNLCFKRLDHHCELLGVCIGERNYAAFFTTITALFAFYGIVIYVGINNLYEVFQTYELEEITWDEIKFPAFYTVLIAFIYPKCGLLVLLLMPFVHLYQIATNRTTKDIARNVWPKDAPESCFLGWIAYGIVNFKKILCAPIIPSELKPLEKVTISKGSLKDLKWAEQPALSEEEYNKIHYHNPPTDLKIYQTVVVQPQTLSSKNEEGLTSLEDPELGLVPQPD